jgi:hypothetical protein
VNIPSSVIITNYYDNLKKMAHWWHWLNRFKQINLIVFFKLIVIILKK